MVYGLVQLPNDCRIIFSFRKDSVTGDDLIVLVDIGSHDEVY
jgi:mRNA-degrading endonuclease YafQ of YafQ-DinJ toxin-antitoxin module